MTLRIPSCHRPQTSGQRHPITHPHSHVSLPMIARASMSNRIETAKSSRPLCISRVKLPNGRTKKCVELNDLHKNRHSSESNLQKETLLTYDEYKNKFLKSYEEYAEGLIRDYSKLDRKIDPEKLKKCYEIYCHGSYNGYKLKMEHHNPGFIL